MFYECNSALHLPFKPLAFVLYPSILKLLIYPIARWHYFHQALEDSRLCCADEFQFALQLAAVNKFRARLHFLDTEKWICSCIKKKVKAEPRGCALLLPPFLVGLREPTEGAQAAEKHPPKPSDLQSIFNVVYYRQSTRECTGWGRTTKCRVTWEVSGWWDCSGKSLRKASRCMVRKHFAGTHHEKKKWLTAE